MQSDDQSLDAEEIRQRLPQPARYIPLEKGVYDLSPGLRLFGTDYGNGKADQTCFQVNREFPKYRNNKEEARRERLGKYYAVHQLAPEVEEAACRFIIDRLLREHSDWFAYEITAEGSVFSCRLTGERLAFDSKMKLVSASTSTLPRFVSALDALACQVAEDIAITTTDGGRDWLSALHLCSPSHWGAEDKIGKDFIAIHKPVPGIESITKVSGSLVEAMVKKGPFLRFVWGFATDKRLNHHPVAPVGWDPLEWSGRSFDPRRDRSPFYLRVERQVIHALPEVRSSLFTIGVSFVDGDEIRRDPVLCRRLISTLKSMPHQSREYKGISRDFELIIEWLMSKEPGIQLQ